MLRNGVRYSVLGLAALFCAPASAAEIKVMNSGGFTAAYKDLAPGCERTTGNTVATAWGASMGTAPDAIPMRLQRGEPADVLIMAAPALDQMITDGKAMPDWSIAPNAVPDVVRDYRLLQFDMMFGAQYGRERFFPGFNWLHEGAPAV